MAETPNEIEINAVMGAQTRSIVRSALLHVKNKLAEEMDDKLDMDALSKEDIQHVVDKELAKWPLSTVGQEDTLPQWLYYRFSKYAKTLGWEDVSEDEQANWEHEAAAVRRAVGQAKAGPDGTPTPPPPQFKDAEMIARHQMLGDVLHKYYNVNGQPMVSCRQMQDLLCGRATADQYDSALQVMPTGVLE